jgi:hypothetical protein
MSGTGTIISLLQACDDPHLFGRWFKDRTTWQAWFAFIAALFALPMTDEQLAIYQRHTGREAAPSEPITESYLICGRRAGKSFVLALIAVYLSCFKSYAEFLGPGERATVVIIAADRKQARQIYRYIRGLITGTPMLAGMLEREPRADGLDLNNGVSIEIGTASFRTSRGYSFAAVLADETAFWPTDDSAEPDFAVFDALRPGMANIPGAVFLCASSPYARRGALHDAFKRWFAKDEAGILVWKAATREMNPTIPQSVIDRANERDPASAAAEYGAEFRSDVESFMSREAVEAVITPGCFERPRVDGITYTAFVDPSGGASDSMTLAIAHSEKHPEDNRSVVFLDAVREIQAPFSPETAVKELATLLKSYGISSVTGDRYGGEWPREAFRSQGIAYRPSELAKSDIYKDFLPRVNSGEVELLDLPRLIAQLCNLERRTARGGRDSIDHPPGSHDDVANAVAGVLVFQTSARHRLPQAVFGTYGRLSEQEIIDQLPPEEAIRRGLLTRKRAIAEGWIPA